MTFPTGPISGYPIANLSPAGWNFNGILSEFRSICGIPDASMYSDAQCAQLINYYYQYVLPKELKIFWGYTYHQFYCQANVDQYPVPVNSAGAQIFQTFNPQVWVDGWQMEWYTDPDTFYQDYPLQLNKMVVAESSTSTYPYNFQLTNFPVLARSVYVSDGTQVAQDVPNSPWDGTGTFVDPNNHYLPLAGGAINYATGVVSNLSFAVEPAANLNITASFYTYMPVRPNGILFFKSKPLPDSTQANLNKDLMFVLRPVPDQVYLIKMQAIQVPQAFVNYTDVPFRPDLGPLIALGAALHRFKLFNQMEQYQQYLPEYQRFKDVCMQDTYEEMLYQRAIPTF
jgi:hypothetical protein